MEEKVDFLNASDLCKTREKYDKIPIGFCLENFIFCHEKVNHQIFAKKIFSNFGKFFFLF